MKIVIATTKKWNIINAQKFKKIYSNQYNVEIITKKEELDYNILQEMKPNYIFFPHWSWLIPENIFRDFSCIVFHMTDLPFGRGGSPLQNLIARGIETTKISAIKVTKHIDEGDVYLKCDLNLNGSAEEIYMRTSAIIFSQMIPFIISNRPLAKPQIGKVTEFLRRQPKDSELSADMDIMQIYDYIRMLDAEGYPKAFIRFGPYKLCFSRASLKSNKIIADVEFICEVEDE